MAKDLSPDGKQSFNENDPKLREAYRAAIIQHQQQTSQLKISMLRILASFRRIP